MLSGDKQGALEFFKLVFRALCLCWDRQTQDLHIDWILFRGRSLVPVSCEVVNDNIDGHYPSSHYPIFAEFLLPRAVRMVDPPTQEENWYASLSTFLIFSWDWRSLLMGFRFILCTLRCIKRGCGSPLVYVLSLYPRVFLNGVWFTRLSFFFSWHLENSRNNSLVSGYVDEKFRKKGKDWLWLSLIVLAKLRSRSGTWVTSNELHRYLAFYSLLWIVSQSKAM